MLRFLSGLLAACSLALAAPAHADVFGVTTDHRLVRFDQLNPTTLKDDRPISGVANGEAIGGSRRRAGRSTASR